MIKEIKSYYCDECKTEFDFKPKKCPVCEDYKQQLRINLTTTEN